MFEIRFEIRGGRERERGIEEKSKRGRESERVWE